MLSVQLMLEVNRRCNHDAGELLLRDACLQAAYCMDAPDDVQDGMHWWDDPELDVHGAVPRVVELREPANVRANLPAKACGDWPRKDNDGQRL